MGRNDQSTCVDTTLPKGFEPSDWHVIVNRGKENHDHVGNQRFRDHVESLFHEYTTATTRGAKAKIVSIVMECIASHCTPTTHVSDIGFVKKDLLLRRWVTVSIPTARSKVSQAFRDMLKAKRSAERKTNLIPVSASILVLRDSLYQDQASVTQKEPFTPNHICSDAKRVSPCHEPSDLTKEPTSSLFSGLSALDTKFDGPFMNFRRIVGESIPDEKIEIKPQLIEAPTKKKRRDLVIDSRRVGPLPDDVDIDSIFSEPDSFEKSGVCSSTSLDVEGAIDLEPTDIFQDNYTVELEVISFPPTKRRKITNSS